MVKFFGAILRGLSEILSILVLVGGGVIGYYVTEDPTWAIIGVLAAFIVCTLFFGMIGMIASNGDKLNKLQAELDELKKSIATKSEKTE